MKSYPGILTDSAVSLFSHVSARTSMFKEVNKRSTSPNLEEMLRQLICSKERRLLFRSTCGFRSSHAGSIRTVNWSFIIVINVWVQIWAVYKGTTSIRVHKKVPEKMPE